MSIFLGQQGMLQLQRSAVAESAQALATTLVPGDVTVVDRRFSADFPPSALITGDHIEIATQDGSNLQLVDGHNYPDGYWFCHVDRAGGIRLYDQFADSISGNKDTALELVAPSVEQPIFIRNRDESFNCVSQTVDWQLSTQRETVDLTVLGEDFRENYANGLISGQGTTTCFWDYTHHLCQEDDAINQELPNYYAQLLLRLEQGAMFKGRFYVHYSQTASSVWYEADCIVSSVGFVFAPGEPIRTTVEFVTTGEIKLIMGQLDRFLLQEDSDFVLQENRFKIKLEETD